MCLWNCNTYYGSACYLFKPNIKNPSLPLKEHVNALALPVASLLDKFIKNYLITPRVVAVIIKLNVLIYLIINSINVLKILLSLLVFMDLYGHRYIWCPDHLGPGLSNVPILTSLTYLQTFSEKMTSQKHNLKFSLKNSENFLFFRQKN